MYFEHHASIWADFSQLAPGVIHVQSLHATADATPLLPQFYQQARQRLAHTSEADLPEIQAWRRAFSQMGLKPTQYRSAAEALLRRFRKEGTLPTLHPLVDLCNAISLAYALPIAVIDLDQVVEGITVRYAIGDEHALAFSGEAETPILVR